MPPLSSYVSLLHLETLYVRRVTSFTLSGKRHFIWPLFCSGWRCTCRMSEPHNRDFLELLFLLEKPVDLYRSLVYLSIMHVIKAVFLYVWLDVSVLCTLLNYPANPIWTYGPSHPNRTYISYITQRITSFLWLFDPHFGTGVFTTGCPVGRSRSNYRCCQTSSHPTPFSPLWAISY